MPAASLWTFGTREDHVGIENMKKYILLFFVMACAGGFPLSCCGPKEPQPPPGESDSSRMSTEQEIRT